MVKNACSTFEAFFAEVSRKGMPMLSANSYTRQRSESAIDVNPYLGDCVLNGTLIGHIALVTNQKLVDTLGSVAIDLLQPLLDIVERVHICDIVNDADTVSATVVG
jgi:hypothetical protein